MSYCDDYTQQVTEREKEVLDKIYKVLKESHLACSISYVPLKDIYQIHFDGHSSDFIIKFDHEFIYTPRSAVGGD